MTASEKPKSLIPKWAIASVAGIAILVGLSIIFFSDASVKSDGEPQQSTTSQETLLIKRVEGAKAPDISIHEAAWEGDIEAVKQHLTVGSELDQKDLHRKTALHEAVRKGHKEIAELLITAGADLNAKNRNGSTPLKLAASWGYEEISELLIAKGADLNAKDKNYRTPLDWSINQKNTSIAELLRKHGGKTGEELK